MATHSVDAQIRKYLPLLGSKEKYSLLDKIKALLHVSNLQKSTHETPAEHTLIDYNKYHFSPADIKFNREEMNEK